jgi:hypothetical protein
VRPNAALLAGRLPVIEAADVLLWQKFMNKPLHIKHNQSYYLKLHGTVFPRLSVKSPSAPGTAIPAVLILGARQVGKTTLATSEPFPGFRRGSGRSAAPMACLPKVRDFDWDARSGHDGLILDEAQRLPVLFDALRGAVDADRAPDGTFLSVSVSAQPSARATGRRKAWRGALEF